MTPTRMCNSLKVTTTVLSGLVIVLVVALIGALAAANDVSRSEVHEIIDREIHPTIDRIESKLDAIQKIISKIKEN